MIKAIIFDLDGVLVDTKMIHFEALNLSLKKYGYKEISIDDHVKVFDGLPTKEKLKILNKKDKLPIKNFSKINKYKQKITSSLLKKKIKRKRRLASSLNCPGQPHANCCWGRPHATPGCQGRP